jgi:uncharacterized protein
VAKFFWLALVVLAVYLLLRKRPRAADQSDRPAPGAEPMVRCAHCGLNVPRSESLALGERYYCSEEHRHLGSGDFRQ